MSVIAYLIFGLILGVCLNTAIPFGAWQGWVIIICFMGAFICGRYHGRSIAKLGPKGVKA